MTTLLSTLKSGSLTLSLNRPERANAFNFEMTTALKDALAAAEKDSQVRCVVITGNGKSLVLGRILLK
jgi:2-(1,2-epoxy-1,2-dihydrophenyl)acetyl-CoA isomerase